MDTVYDRHSFCVGNSWGARMAAGPANGVAGEAGLVELLWGLRQPPSRGPKPTLSVGRIVEAAVDVADAEGLAAVSMQRVADALDVTKMALYRYLAGKAELL